MLISEPQARLLGSDIDGLVEALEGLKGELAREREVLSERSSPEALEQVATQKQHAVERVSGLYTQLQGTLARLVGADDVARAMSGLRHSQPQLGHGVDRLLALTRECHQANQDNGVLVGAGLRSARRALDTIHHLTDAGAAATYGPQGHAEAQLASTDRLALRA